MEQHLQSSEMNQLGTRLTSSLTSSETYDEQSLRKNAGHNVQHFLYIIDMAVEKCSRVVFICPPKKSGGPENIYQACRILASRGYESYVMHTDASKNAIPGLEKYNVTIVPAMPDAEDTLVVIPEDVALRVVKPFKKSRRALWWLSVDTFMLVNDIDLSKMSVASLLMLERIDFNFVQSRYAEDFCYSMGVKDVRQLPDTISDEFFAPASRCRRADAVLYNPLKERSVTQLAASLMPHLKFIPLHGFSSEQMASLMDVSKVYLDLGGHPGRDRIPREACLRDMVVITSKNGSARNSTDVAIPERWKVECGYFNVPKICSKVQAGIDTYDEALKDFTSWKKTIINDRDEFESRVISCFEDLLEKQAS